MHLLKIILFILVGGIVLIAGIRLKKKSVQQRDKNSSGYNFFILSGGFLLVCGLLILINNPDGTRQSSANPSPPENVENEDSFSNVDDSSQDGHVCYQCGKTGNSSSEIHSTGDIVSGGQPYYVCSYECAQKQYAEVVSKQNHSTNIPEYNSDACGLCNGSGFETNSYGDKSICAACGGTGVQR